MEDLIFNATPKTREGFSNSSVALIINEHAEILFIERTKRPTDPWSGHMSFPGGRADGKETTVETATRETFEETGLHLKVDQFKGFLQSVQGRKSGQMLDFYVHGHVFYLDGNFTSFNICKNEVADIFWIPLSLFLQDNLIWKDFGGNDLPCFPFKRNDIWGLSFIFLCRYLYRLEDPRFKYLQKIIESFEKPQE